MKYINLIIFLTWSHNICFGQTAGSGTLSTIESLVQKELKNSEEIGNLNRKHMDSYVSEDVKSKRLDEELIALEEKKAQNEIDVQKKLEAKLDEIENGSSWKNRRESAQSGYKEYNPGTCNAGGPPPICVVDHWYRVSVAEAMAEYEALVEKELNKIKNQMNKYDKDLEKKRDEIFNFRDGDNEFSELRDKIGDEINELFAENQDIRARIAELSKIYVDQIQRELESQQNQQIQALMNEIAEKHYAFLKIGVLEAKIIELDQQEAEAIQNLSKRMDRANDTKITQHEQKIILLKNEIIAKKNEIDLEIDNFNSDLTKYKTERRAIEEKLKKRDGLDKDETLKLENREKELESLINSLDYKKEQTAQNFNIFKNQKEFEIQVLNDEIWNLKIKLPTLKYEAENNLKEAYTVKREVLEDAISGRKLKLTIIEGNISVKRDEFREKVKNYENLVESERIRLMDACRESGSSCWGGEVVSNIWSNANKLISCSHDMENSGVLYTGCEEAFTYYSTIFNSKMNGISDENLGNLRRMNPSRKYEQILEKLK